MHDPTPDPETVSCPDELLQAIAAEAEHLEELEPLLITLQRFQLDAAAGVLVAGIRAQLLILQAAADALEQLDLLQLSRIGSDDLTNEDPCLLDPALLMPTPLPPGSCPNHTDEQPSAECADVAYPLGSITIDDLTELDLSLLDT